MGTRTQYGLVGAQQEAVNSQLKNYKEMTNEMDVNPQATKAVIQQRNQALQSQWLVLQASQIQQCVNQHQWANMGNHKWNNSNNNVMIGITIITTTTVVASAGAGRMITETLMLVAVVATKAVATGARTTQTSQRLTVSTTPSSPPTCGATTSSIIVGFTGMTVTTLVAPASA